MQKIRDLICENRRTNCHRGMASVLQERWSIGHPLQGDTQVRNVRCALVVKPNRGNFDQVRFYTLMTFWPFFWAQSCFSSGFNRFFLVENRPSFHPLSHFGFLCSLSTLEQVRFYSL